MIGPRHWTNGWCRWGRVCDWWRAAVTQLRSTALVEKLCLVLTLRHWLRSYAVEHPCDTGGCRWVRLRYGEGNAVEERGGIALESEKPVPHDRAAALGKWMVPLGRIHRHLNCAYFWRLLLRHRLRRSIPNYLLTIADQSGMILITQPLVNDNYHFWSRAMRKALNAKRKLGFVTFRFK
ncbi:hypothetical protein PIB30_053994 [Stylosanthes scabra]|uniref:Retrotransposon Copia-like N-terminal domain-containing protein n=1 Tax=Stylosanthes scabra TaxID=79078 RepID=A0ABU6TKP6_9FABA|nr:hypothetical protein [Stylosanthes scabra]